MLNANNVMNWLFSFLIVIASVIIIIFWYDGFNDLKDWAKDFIYCALGISGLATVYNTWKLWEKK